MKNCLTMALGVLVCMGSQGVPAFGHPDDPKVLDRVPRYEGPGWSRGRDGDRGITPDFDALNITLESWISLPQFGPQFSAANDCWGYTSPSGREYAMIGLSDGTGFVEVTDPSNPQILGTIPGPNSIWRDVKVFLNYAYIVSEGGSGIQVIDLSNIDSGSFPQIGTILTGGVASTHNVAINEDSGYLYRCGGQSTIGLRIYNLNSTPASPTYVNQWVERYVHDAEIVSYTSGPYAGREIAFCCSGFNGGSTQTGFEILDVTDKQNIFQLSRIVYPGGAYSHQVWISEDRQWAFLNDELDERDAGLPSTTLVFNIADLSFPSLSGSFTNGRVAITHNNYTKDGYLFAANYTDGLRVFDVINPTAGQEVAYFDTRPESAATTFNGLWSVYPYFESGTIIGSDIERGLFVWSVQLPGVSISHPNGLPTFVDPRGDSVSAAAVSRNGGSLMPGSLTLHYDDGSGFVSVPMTETLGDDFTGALPSIDCGETIQYYFSAMDGEGVEVFDPPSAPDVTYSAIGAIGQLISFADDFEVNNGWTVGAPTDTATTGIWVRADPIAAGGQPEDDNPAGQGTQCFITGNGVPGGATGAADIDNGATTLTSPLLDATELPGIPMIAYYRWYSNSRGSNPGQDIFPIEISNDNGQTWTALEIVSQSLEAWTLKSFVISDFVAPTNQMRIRFVARDDAPGSVVEAGVDDVILLYLECPPASCDGDADGNLAVDVNDISYIVFRLGATAPDDDGADVDGSGSVDVNDISYCVFRLGSCPTK